MSSQSPPSPTGSADGRSRAGEEARAAFAARIRARGRDAPCDVDVWSALDLAMTAAKGPFADAFAVPDADFAARLADRVPLEGSLAASLAALRASDLYLARACALGDGRAIATFESTFASDLLRAHRRLRGGRVPWDDFLQELRGKLFAAPTPRIDEYAGTGELRSWVRVTATRTLVDLARRSGKEVADRDDGAARLPSPDVDPELSYMKQLYRREVAESVEEAARELSPEDRNILREAYVDGLSIDQLGALHGIHRATAARRLTRAREALVTGTRKALAARIRVSSDELSSILRLVESQLHVTAARIFA